MKVKILEDIKHEGQQFTKDEQLTVDDALGTYFCNAGWAKDMAGKVKTAERDPHRKVLLDVASAGHKQTAGEAG